MLVKQNSAHLRAILGFFLLLILSACSTGQESPSTLLPTEEIIIPNTIAASPSGVSPVSVDTPQPPTPSPNNPLLDKDCLENKGSLSPFQISRTDLELTGSIYTPPCYGDDQEMSYPVLYLMHGTTETDQQWLDLGIADQADRLISQGLITPLIIVLPKELTWVPLPENPFGDYLVTVLIPWIDQNYQTHDNRDFRAIGGLSRGGNWALRIGLLHWGLFGSIGGHSTPLFYGDLNKIPAWIDAIPPSRIPRIYLDIGEGDNNYGDAEKLEALLDELDVPHERIINPGLHNETYWSEHLEDYLFWYNAGWKGINE